MRRALLLLALLPTLPACGGARDDASGDASTAATAFAPDLSRVVCVSKQLNELVYAVGAQDHLVARDLTSIYPPEIEQLPDVGYHRALSAEGILSMRPSLFLTDGNVGPDAVLEQVEKVGIPIKVMEPGRTVADAQQLLADVGALFGIEDQAGEVLATWRAGMEQVRADSARWATGPHPKVLMMHFGQLVNNYLGLNSGGAAGAILKWAGGVNAIDSIGGMTRLTPELIARLAPDVILATDLGYDRLGSMQKFARMPGVDLTPAAKNGRIYRVEEQEIMYFGPRTPATVAKVGAMLHPDATGFGG